MGSEPDVSVVIPAYQMAHSVATAIQSAQTQVPPPREIIVVDDGSSDGTAEVAAAVGGIRLFGQTNQGPSAARNRGIAEASGTWVAFLDADDCWLPGKLAAQAWARQRCPGTVLVAGDWVRRVSSSDLRTGRVTDAPAMRQISYRDILVLNRFQTSTVMVKRDVLDAVGGFDPCVDGVEDWDLWLRCARHGAIVKLTTPLVMYHDSADGYSKGLERVYRTMLLMVERERDTGWSPKRQFSSIEAWHHLRFALAFELAGDRSAARQALRDLHQRRLLRQVPAATLRYLLPFMAMRLRRRLERWYEAAAARRPPELQL
jgi:glycosyltransferase involved in cell wall biosynthesis